MSQYITQLQEGAPHLVLVVVLGRPRESHGPERSLDCTCTAHRSTGTASSSGKAGAASNIAERMNQGTGRDGRWQGTP